MIIENQEPWEHLKGYGYAPGNYWGKCKTCEKTYTGDKRSWRCFSCAGIARLTAIEEAAIGYAITADAVENGSTERARWAAKVQTDRIRALLALVTDTMPADDDIADSAVGINDIEDRLANVPDALIRLRRIEAAVMAYLVTVRILTDRTSRDRVAWALETQPGRSRALCDLVRDKIPQYEDA